GPRTRRYPTADTSYHRSETRNRSTPPVHVPCCVPFVSDEFLGLAPLCPPLENRLFSRYRHHVDPRRPPGGDRELRGHKVLGLIIRCRAEIVTRYRDRPDEAEPLVEMEEESYSVLPDDFQFTGMWGVPLVLLDKGPGEADPVEGRGEDLRTRDGPRPLVGEHPAAVAFRFWRSRDHLDPDLLAKRPPVEIDDPPDRLDDAPKHKWRRDVAVAVANSANRRARLDP